jgi:hypothetical protein
MEKILSPDIVRKTCLYHSEPGRPGMEMNGKFGSALDALKKAVQQLDPEGNEVADQNRRLVCAFLFTKDEDIFKPKHGDQFTPQERNALYRWVSPRPAVVDGVERWYPRSTFRAEANWILSVVLVIQASQTAAGNQLRMKTLMNGYMTECKAVGSLDSDEYWLAQALALPGALVTKIYEGLK